MAFAGACTLVGLIRLCVGGAWASQIRKRSQRLPGLDSDIQAERLREQVDVLRAELGILSEPEIRVSSELNTAATIGVVKPVILLPNQWRDWSEAEVRAVLAHELAHVRHGDFLANVVSQFGVVLHFYNPLVHWLARRLQLEQELAADATASQLAGGRQAYAKILASIALEHQSQFVGWPARPFLPTRSTFLRRLDMLRESRSDSNRRLSRSIRHRTLSWLALASFLVLALGIRPATTQLHGQQASTASKKKYSEGYDLSYVAQDDGLLLLCRPAKMLAELGPKWSQSISALRALDSILSPFQLEPSDIDQLVVGGELTSQFPYSVYMKVTTKLDSMAGLEGSPVTQFDGRQVWELADGRYAWHPDDQSLVINSPRNIRRFIEGRSTYAGMLDSKVWQELQNSDAVALYDGSSARKLLDQVRSKIGIQATSMIAPIVDETELLAIGVSTDESLSLKMLSECSDETGCELTLQTADADFVVLKNMLGEGIKTIPEDSSERRQFASIQTLFDSFFTSLKSSSEGNVASLSATVPLTTPAFEFLSEGLRASDLASARTDSANNLRVIALAMHNFESANRRFPNSVETQKDGKPCQPYSWRVALLPYLGNQEYQELHAQYKFDEPWNSDANTELLRKIPKYYGHPQNPSDSTSTSYLMPVGPETLFAPGLPVEFRRVTDGLANTIMMIEVKSDIPWTKPADLPIDFSKPMPELGGYSSGGFQVAIADGSVRFIAEVIDQQILKALLTSRGGEVAPLRNGQ